MAVGGGRADLDAAIAALEAQRPTLGDAVTDLALAPLQEALAALAPIAAADDAPQLKQVTILFVDLVGSTAIANRLDPEDVAELIDGILHRFTAVAETHRGRVFNYTGDGLVAVFGADEAREDDAELAVRAGLAIIDDVRRAHADVADQFELGALDVRVGIDTGAVVLGGGIEGERNIRGNAVNVAARMEQSAPVGGLRISHDTYRLVRGLFHVTEQDPITVKGIAAPVRTYLVRGAKPRAFRVATRGIEGLETDMVGRAAELGRLQSTYAAVHSDATLRSVTVVAEPGLGKSRLLYEFENWAEVQQESFVIFKGRAQPQTRQQPYGLLRDLFAWRFQIADNDPAEVARERFVLGLRALFVDEGDAPVDLLGHAIGLDFSESPHVRGIVDDPEQIRIRAIAAAGLAFRRMATRAAPVVMVLEDLHWADDDTLDFLTHLTRNHADVPMLLLASARPLLFERRPSWIADTAPNERIDLDPLPPEQAAALADVLLAKLDAVPDVLRAALTDRAGGNPFFIEEIFKMLLDEGALVSTGEDRWHVVPERLDTVAVPTTLMGVLQARQDALAGGERTALQQASVIGFLFWDRALAALDEHSPGSLAPLSRRGFVSPQLTSSIADACEYTFQHHLLQQFTYDSVLKRERREYHARAAAWLAELGAQRGPEFLGATGEHYERAGDPVEALDYYTRAAESATARGARHAALEYAARALHLAQPDDHATRWRLLVARESILALGDDPGAYDDDLAALAATADALDDDAKRAEATLRLAAALMSRGEHDAGAAAARRTLELAEESGSPRCAALAYSELTTWGRRTNRMIEARDFAEQGLALARQVGDRRVVGNLLNALGNACKDTNDYERQGSLTLEALEIARDTGDRVQEALLLNNIACAHAEFGDLETAVAEWELAVAITQEIEYNYGEAILRVNLAGDANLRAGWAGALDHATEAVRLASASKSRDLEAAATLNVGLAQRGFGNRDEAREALTRSREMFIANASMHYALDPMAALAVLDLDDGDRGAALANVQAVLDFIAAGGDLVAIEQPYRVRLDCFTVLDRLGDPRAGDFLDESRTALLEHAAQVPEAVREHFLRADLSKCGLLDAWEARSGAEAG